MSILPNQSLPFTCCVCGQPFGSISVAMAGAPGQRPGACKSCGNSACPKHFSKSKKLCVRCATGRQTWCRTPPSP